ncbi:S41 family peptidase [Tsuneonella sp. HG222]
MTNAVEAITEFTEAFGDSHLRGDEGPANPAALRNAAGGESAENTAAADEPVAGTCEGLGYREAIRYGAFDPASLPGWKRLESPWFTAGTSGRIGFLRLHSFAESDYLAACRASWQDGRTERAVQLATRKALQGELARIAVALRDQGAEILTLDLTRNGGGSEWSEEAAALFTSRELTRPRPRLVVPCGDRSGVWRGEKVCSNLEPAGQPDSIAGTGAWTGPVALLVDSRTASAAEDFAYWLAGSGQGSMVGRRTLGAGCGYVDGGWAYQLKAINGHVMMPNCSRYTAQGVNQIEGLEPDVAYDWDDGITGLSAVLDRMTASAR